MSIVVEYSWCAHRRCTPDAPQPAYHPSRRASDTVTGQADPTGARWGRLRAPQTAHLWHPPRRSRTAPAGRFAACSTAATLATWLNTTCGRAIEGTRVVTQAIRAGVPITLGVLAPELLARSGACEAAAVLRHKRLAQRRRRGERGALRSVSSAPARPIAEHCCTRFGISTVRSCASSGCVARAPPQLYLTRGTTYQSPSGLAGTDAAPLNDCE
jgi:hypothetical protein